MSDAIKSASFVRVARTALRDGIALTTGQNYVVQIAPALRVDLEIEPDAGSTMDDKYTLRSTDQAERYSKTLTVKDDKIAGDHMITLEFEDVHEGLSYTLEVDQGAEGGKYTVFETIPYDDLRD